MSREIIVLEVNPSDGGYITINCVFWFGVAASSQIPKPAYNSSVNAQLAGGSAVNATESNLLQTGAMLEEYNTFKYPNTFTVAQIKTELVTAWTTRNTYLQSLPAKISNYGLSFDSATGWSA